METYQWILLIIYLCVNCFYTGAEWSDNGYTKWFILGFLFFIPMWVTIFLWYFIKLVLGKKL
jgi:hypothetical protein